MLDSTTEMLKSRLAKEITSYGIQALARNSAIRAKTLVIYSFFSIILFCASLLINQEVKALGKFSPFLIPFLLFLGSVGMLQFYRALYVSDFRAWSYLEKASERSGKAVSLGIIPFSLDSKNDPFRNIRLENYFYIGLTSLISGLFAICSIWREGWLIGTRVGSCFLALGFIFSIFLNHDFKKGST